MSKDQIQDPLVKAIVDAYGGSSFDPATAPPAPRISPDNPTGSPTGPPLDLLSASKNFPPGISQGNPSDHSLKPPEQMEREYIQSQIEPLAKVFAGPIGYAGIAMLGGTPVGRVLAAIKKVEQFISNEF